MSARSPDEALVACLRGALFVDADDLAIGDGLAVGRGRSSPRSSPLLRAWDLATGVLRWERALWAGDVAIDAGVVHVCVVDDDGLGAIASLDAETGATVAELAIGDEPGALRIVDGARYVFSRRRVVRVDADPAESDVVGGEWPRFAGVTPRRCIALSDEGVFAFARADLSTAWSLDCFVTEAVVAREVVVVSAMLPPDVRDEELFCLDADTGARRWSLADPRLRPLAIGADVALASDHLGWLVALSIETGEVRWTQWIERSCDAAVAVEDGWIALTGRALFALRRDGTLVASRPLSHAGPGRASFAVAEGRVVCGASARGELVEARVAPLPPDERACEPVVGVFQWADGASTMQPALEDEARVREVLTSVTDLDEAWEALVARRIIPASWATEGERIFVGLGDSERASRPSTRPWMLSFASSSRSVTRVEALLRESLARLAAWGARVPEGPLRWRNEPDAIGVLRDEGLWASARSAIEGSVSREVGDEIERRVVQGVNASGTMTEWGESAFIADAMWQTAASNRHRVRSGACQGVLVEDLPNPFEPLVEIASLGYGWRRDGALVCLTLFDDALVRLPPRTDFDIPF